MISKKVILAGVCFFFSFFSGAVLLTSIPAAAGESSYLYREQTGELTTIYSLIYKKKGVYRSIFSRQQHKLFTALCLEDGTTHYWSFQNQRGDKVTARMVKDDVHIFGRVDGKIIEQAFSLNGVPWYQPLSYSLRKVLDDAAKAMHFWTIRPDTFTPVLLEANKLECSSISVNGQGIDACGVEIRKSGLMSVFWRASYWFRQSDHLFVQYRGTHGLPGTDETLIELVSAPIEKDF